ncbi:hypothetical protein [Streptomyces profundus]|uniref:hypothetical protein n=1 Tax=Streptomyces profundus TaxID=2867410 RepID=UPI001D1601AA|nr:hypothetical protein [Streptomyces sp. MA3_2.13]UED84253.1 hypothetical protein K4G22_08550 [Streptomyces sp. MA3_2.13]
MNAVPKPSGKGRKNTPSEEANLDDDSGLWPTSYAVSTLTEAGEETIRELVEKAVS